MLYMPPGTSLPVRVHGAYVADEEVHRVVAAWQTYGKPTYLDEITEGAVDLAGNGEGGAASGEADPLYDQAVRVVTEARRASISLVQRRLKIGYNRAARLMEEMENAGLVTSPDNSGSREVLAAPPAEI
jgi:S-DNA-T family DNA segregation ATPase FtsK/SpoIIIE